MGRLNYTILIKCTNQKKLDVKHYVENCNRLFGT